MADEGAAAPRPLRVLVVDSHSQSRKAAVGLLELCEYKVTAVATAKEALALLSLDPLVPTFDLLLKDHHPAAGVNACRMLAKLKNTPWAKLPVVVCSDQDSRAEVLKCFNLGAADYLVKPLRQNEIRNLWTRVPVLVALFSKGRAGTRSASQDFPETDPSPGAYESSPTDSADTSGLDDNLTIKEVSPLIADRNDHSQQQDTEKVGAGSNGVTTSAHGSYTAQEAFPTNLYSAGARYPAAHCSPPILRRPAAHHNGSGEGNTTGSGQGSGSGNQISQSAAGWDEALGSQAPANKGQSSIGNGSAVGNVACDSGSVAYKRQAEQQPLSSSEVPCCGDSVFQAERPAPDSSAAVDASRGFRAWIRPMHTSSPAQALEYEQPLISLALSGKLSDSMQLPALGTLPAAPTQTWSNAAAASSRLASGGSGTGLSTATRMVHAAHCSNAPPSVGVDSVEKSASLGRISALQPGLLQQQQRVVHVQQQEQQLRQQEAPATAATQEWAAAPAAQAQMQRLQHHVNSQMLANFAQGGGGGVLPHMLAHGMNPFAFHMPSPGPVSRDDMPLPYGEHHLMQAGAQRMQAQQQAAAAKQAEMQQQLGAAMLASYPGYLPSPFGRVGFPCIQSSPCWPIPRNPVQQQQQQRQQQNQHGLHQYAHPQQFAQSAPNSMPLSAALLPAGSAHLMSGLLPGPGRHLHSYPSASTLVCSGVPDSAGCRPECCTPSGALGGMSTDGRPTVSAATNLTSATAGGGSIGGELSHKERRAQALYKYKQKRKNLCFTKKIRYESRKQLAQARPRIKGQFVRVPVGGSEAALGSGELLDAAASLERMPEEDVSETFTADMATASDEVALGYDVMADEDVQEYDRIGSESEKSIDVLEAGLHAEERVAQDCSPVEAAIEVVKGHKAEVSQPAALHVAAGGVASKHHTVHVTNACAQAARQAKANAAEARRNGSDRGSNSPDEDGIGQDI